MGKRASTNKLSFLEQYYSQTHIEKILGVSPRYQRLIKEGKRSGAKYADAIDALFDLVRKSPAPPKKRRRPRRKRPIIGWVSVSDMMNVLFSIFEPRTYKPPKIAFQHKETLFLWPTSSWPTGKRFNTWFVFFITLAVLPPGDRQFARYRRVLEPTDDDEDEKETPQEEPDSIEYFLETLSNLPPQQRSLIEHLGLEEKILAVADQLPATGPLFVNFWMSRFPSAFYTPQQAERLVIEHARGNVEQANAEEELFYVFLGVYAFYGFNI